MTGQPRDPRLRIREETRQITGLHGLAVTTTAPEGKTERLADLMTATLVIQVRVRQSMSGDGPASKSRHQPATVEQPTGIDQ